MAQKTENEEVEFKVVFCVECGVAGNTCGNNVCHKCFSAAGAVSTSAASPMASEAGANVFGEETIRSGASGKSSLERVSNRAETTGYLKTEVPTEAAPPAKREVSRCSRCRRKVGLIGFRCRCGDLFCADHRHSYRHDCSYDYKATGREAIAKDNPVVKAAKIVRI